MSNVIPIERAMNRPTGPSAAPTMGLAERFWSLARGMEASALDRSPVGAVRHVLAVLDALDRGEQGGDVSVHTLSFLALLRESEQRGDVSYASPEQLRGESLDERSLVFSVGVLLFERLTGRHPYGRDQSHRLARIQRGEMGSGVNYFPNVPAGLRALLMRAMGPFPEERFHSLTELRARLEQFIQDHASAGRANLPGTYGSVGARPAAPQPESTRVVRMATAFGRDLMAISAPGQAQPGAPRHAQSSRRDRMSQLHLHTVGGRIGTDLEPAPSQASGQPSPAPAPGAEPTIPFQRRDDEARPAMATSQRRDESQRPAMAPLPDASAAPAPASQAAPTHAAPSPAPGPRVRAASHAEPLPTPVDLDLRPRASAGLLPRLAWAGIGALVAASLMWYLTRPDPALTEPLTLPRASALAAVDPQPEPSDPAQTSPASQTASQASAPATFSAEHEGAQLSERVAQCFTDERRAQGVRFRVGLRFGGTDGTVDRLFFSTAEELPATERACVRDAALGLVPSAAPDNTQVIDYQLRLSRSAIDVTVKS